jgi:hypothetical protein
MAMNDQPSQYHAVEQTAAAGKDLDALLLGPGKCKRILVLSLIAYLTICGRWLTLGGYFLLFWVIAGNVAWQLLDQYIDTGQSFESNVETVTRNSGPSNRVFIPPSFDADVLLGAIVCGIVLAVIHSLLLYVNCRATFVLIDNIANASAKLFGPWYEQRRPGNSLFRLRLLIDAVLAHPTRRIACNAPDCRCQYVRPPVMAAALFWRGRHSR